MISCSITTHACERAIGFDHYRCISLMSWLLHILLYPGSLSLFLSSWRTCRGHSCRSSTRTYHEWYRSAIDVSVRLATQWLFWWTYDLLVCGAVLLGVLTPGAAVLLLDRVKAFLCVNMNTASVGEQQWRTNPCRGSPRSGR